MDNPEKKSSRCVLSSIPHQEGLALKGMLSSLQRRPEEWREGHWEHGDIHVTCELHVLWCHPLRSQSLSRFWGPPVTLSLVLTKLFLFIYFSFIPRRFSQYIPTDSTRMPSWAHVSSAQGPIVWPASWTGWRYMQTLNQTWWESQTRDGLAMRLGKSTLGAGEVAQKWGAPAALPEALS